MSEDTKLDASVRREFSELTRSSAALKARAERASLVGARLDYADLSHADLRKSDFTSAKLPSANLHGARQDDCIWDQADLTAVKRTDRDRAESEAWSPPPRPRAEEPSP